jgi:hypothetical protein
VKKDGNFIDWEGLKNYPTAYNYAVRQAESYKLKAYSMLGGCVLGLLVFGAWLYLK